MWACSTAPAPGVSRRNEEETAPRGELPGQTSVVVPLKSPTQHTWVQP